MNLFKALYVLSVFLCMHNASAASLQERLAVHSAELVDMRGHVLAGAESLSNSAYCSTVCGGSRCSNTVR